MSPFSGLSSLVSVAVVLASVLILFTGLALFWGVASIPFLLLVFGLAGAGASVRFLIHEGCVVAVCGVVFFKTTLVWEVASVLMALCPGFVVRFGEFDILAIVVFSRAAEPMKCLFWGLLSPSWLGSVSSGERCTSMRLRCWDVVMTL